MRNSYKIAIGIAVVAGVWIGSGQFGDTANEAAKSQDEVSVVKKNEALTKVRISRSIAQVKVKELVILGKTEASRSVDLKAETSGRIIAVMAEKGDRVKKGDVIAKVALDDRQSRLQEAKAKLEQRQIEYQAAKELSARNFSTKVKFAETQALLDSAKASLAAITLDINRTVMRAPFDGVLETRPVEIGDLIAIGSSIATVVDLSPIQVVANVPESQIGLVQKGIAAKGRLVTGKLFDGIVSFVSSDAVNATRTFKIEVETPNEDFAIVAGLTTELRLSLGEVMAHRISPAVLTLSDAGLVGIKSVNAESIVEFHPIKLVADTPEGMWLGGLPEQLAVISRGQEFVKVGQKVDAVAATATALTELKGRE